MRDILTVVERHLRPLVLRFDLTLADDDLGEKGSEEQLWQLEYWAPTPDGRRLRLDVCQLSQARSIVAELWDPNDLAGLVAEASVEIVAIGRRTWVYGCDDGPDDLVREVAGQIEAWLEQHCSS